MRRIAILTGQSDPRSAALSPAQADFLDRIRPPDCEVIRTGFPYTENAGYRDVPILRASVRNARQVLWTFSESFPKQIGERIDTLSLGVKRLILITGSCGLQMANAAWPRLTAAAEIQVVALGPVCLTKLRMPIVAIRGRRDIWSRLMFGGAIDYHCDCGHLAYWESEEVRALAGRLVR
jgi:hypothetical protein